MADLKQRSNDLTAALQAYDALLCHELERRRLQQDFQPLWDKLEPTEKEAFGGIARIMAKSMGLEV